MAGKRDKNQVLIYNGMEITIEVITPAIAAKYLGVNSKRNRKVNSSWVGQYSNAMVEGKWADKPFASICFDEQGELGNGQHTLHAIIKSGKTQELLVARKVPTVVLSILDAGRGKTVLDVARTLGQDLGGRSLNVSSVIAYGAGKQRRGHMERIEMYERYKSVVDTVIGLSGKTQMVGLTACVLGVCARALYSYDRERIARFISILKDGGWNTEKKEEKLVVGLRDLARSNSSESVTNRVMLYQKTEYALLHFLWEVPKDKLLSISEEVFPLPGQPLTASAKATLKGVIQWSPNPDVDIPVAKNVC